MRAHLIVLILSVLFTSPTWAKRFDTSYMRLEIPDTWGCEKVKNYWICKDMSQAKSDAILYLLAKVATPDESLNSFWEQFRSSKVIPNANNVPIASKVYSLQKVNISNQEWVQALHGNSEIEGYATYYLSTLHNGISILVSMSILQSRYEAYKNILSNTMYSIQLKNIDLQQKAKKKRGLITTAKMKFNQLNKKSKLALGLILISVIALIVSFKK